MPLEAKDMITIGISTLALVLSAVSVSYTWRQYALAAAKDAREVADREPVVKVTSTRDPSPVRRFRLLFEITNTPFFDVELKTVELVLPTPFGFSNSALADPPMLRAVVMAGGPHHIAKVEPNVIARGERREVPLSLDIPDKAALPPGTIVKLKVHMQIYDNAGRQLIIERSVPLNN